MGPRVSRTLHPRLQVLRPSGALLIVLVDRLEMCLVRAPKGGEGLFSWRDCHLALRYASCRLTSGRACSTLLSNLSSAPSRL